MKHPYLFISIFFLLYACGGNDDESPATGDISQWFSERSLEPREVNGIFYSADSTNPSGTAIQNGQVVAFYYSVFDLDDNLLASRAKASRDSALAKVGAGALFPVSLDQALLLMRTGEIYDFILTPEVGYGVLSGGIIPNDVPIRVRIEAVGVFSESEIFTIETNAIDNFINNNNLNDTGLNPVDPVEQFGSGIAYKRRVAGSGSAPINGDTIAINFQLGEMNGAVVENRTNFEYVYGSDFPRSLIPAFEFAVGRMLVNELALVLVPSSQAYRESVSIIPAEIANELISELIVPDYAAQVHPYATLSMEIRRVD